MSDMCVSCGDFYASIENKCSVCYNSTWTISLKSIDKTVKIHIDRNNTVRGLKCLACNHQLGMHPDAIQAIFAGSQLVDEQTLSESGLRNGATVHIVGTLRGD